MLNKGTTGTIFITSLVWRGPWLGVEPGTSRTRSQHYTTRLSRRWYFPLTTSPSIQQCLSGLKDIMTSFDVQLAEVSVSEAVDANSQITRLTTLPVSSRHFKLIHYTTFRRKYRVSVHSIFAAYWTERNYVYRSYLFIYFFLIYIWNDLLSNKRSECYTFIFSLKLWPAVLVS